MPDDLHYMDLDGRDREQESYNSRQENQEGYYETRSKSRKTDKVRSFEDSRESVRKRARKYSEPTGSYYESRGYKRTVKGATNYNTEQRHKKYDEAYQQRVRRFMRPIGRSNAYHREYGRSRFHRSGQSSEVIFYIILFILVAVLFKYVILKSVGMTAVAAFVIILTVVGHIRDK